MQKKGTSLAATSDQAIFERLLSVAREIFARKGYSGTSVREIVVAAGVTKPVLYYYFRNKERVYLESFREPLARLAAFLDEFSNGRGSAAKRLRQFCSRLHLLFCEHVELLSLLQGFPPGTPSLDIEDCYKRLWETLRHLIHDATEQGAFEKGNVEEKAALILGAVYMASRARIGDRKTGIQGKTLPKILDVIFKSELRGMKKRG
ncbi:MAG: TetR/AcrR family transcriptional regulator [Syntrophorhabdales bacterium]|jgi:AcrR family transcriptional regulator